MLDEQKKSVFFEGDGDLILFFYLKGFGFVAGC